MKTSFYFVLWMLIYPLLGLFNSSFIDNNAFIVALAIVCGVSWLLNSLMPDTQLYERVSHTAPILEDVYTGNVSAFKKRLSQESAIEIVVAIYFTVTTIVIALVIYKTGVNDWLSLVIFVFFTFDSISRSISLIDAKSKLKSNPTSEQCMKIAEETYKLDYTSYHELHYGVSFQDMLPPRPRYFKVFNVFSIIIAVIASLFGLLYIFIGIKVILSQSSLETGAFAGMYFFYGVLATYFGVKDFITSIHFKATQ